MNSQELFDTIATHLLIQNQTSKRGGECLLHGPDGLKCAIGCLIPDALYVPEMEGFSSPDGFLGTYPVVASRIGLTRDQIPLLATLQLIHDDFDPEEWPKQLSITAAERGLNDHAVKPS